jgi:hypothetical protein
MTWNTSVSSARSEGGCNPIKPSLRDEKADTIYFSWSERWERVFLDWHCAPLPPDSFCSVAVERSNSGGCEFHHSQATASHVFIQNVQKGSSSMCHSSPGSHCSGPGWIPGQVMRDLWWTKWHWDRFPPSTSVSFANSQSTLCSTLIYHPGLVRYYRPRSDQSIKWTQSHPTPRTTTKTILIIQ